MAAPRSLAAPAKGAWSAISRSFPPDSIQVPNSRISFFLQRSSVGGWPDEYLE